MERVPVDSDETCDLEIDSMGRVHVVSNHGLVVDGGLFYSVRELDGGWVTERILTNGGTSGTVYGVGSGAKLEFDGAGQPHLAFLATGIPNGLNRQRLFYATKPQGAWQIEEVEDAGFQINSFFQFQLDTAGVAHLGYRILNAVAADGGVAWATRYASRSAAGSWTLETVSQNEARPAHATTLSLDAQGRPVVFYARPESLDAGAAARVYASTRLAANVWSDVDVQVPGAVMARSAAGLAPGGQQLLMAQFSYYRTMADGGWESLPTSTAGNSPVMRRAPNGAVWDITNTSPASSSGLLNVGRYVNGRRDALTPSGITAVRYTGLTFDGTGRPWTCHSRADATGTPLGIYLVRFD